MHTGKHSQKPIYMKFIKVLSIVERTGPEAEGKACTHKKHVT